MLTGYFNGRSFSALVMVFDHGRGWLAIFMRDGLRVFMVGGSEFVKEGGPLFVGDHVGWASKMLVNGPFNAKGAFWVLAIGVVMSAQDAAFADLGNPCFQVINDEWVGVVAVKVYEVEVFVGVAVGGVDGQVADNVVTSGIILHLFNGCCHVEQLIDVGNIGSVAVFRAGERTPSINQYEMSLEGLE